MDNIVGMLHEFRESAKLTQAELARRLPDLNATRISRTESGEVALSREDACTWAKAIGTDEAVSFANYLEQKWSILPRPEFKHPDRNVLWNAEQALQRLRSLEDEPDIKNVFLQRIRNCGDSLERLGRFLLCKEHPIVFVGSPGIGKTALVCGLADLRLNDKVDGLPRQMVLQVGGGRTTICEVQIRYGEEYAIFVKPYSDTDIRNFVSEFVDMILDADRSAIQNGMEVDNVVSGLSLEIAKALRNLAGLPMPTKKHRDNEGKQIDEDQARVLAKQYPQKSDLIAQIIMRMNLPLRQDTMLRCPDDMKSKSLEWLKGVFSKINGGSHPGFSLPERIEIYVPKEIFNAPNLDLRLIDTRGVDEPRAIRRDLQAYVDNQSAVLVFCSSFNDAPDAAMRVIMEQFISSGQWEAIANRSILAVLPKNGEETNVRDQFDELAEDILEGRSIKEDQAREKLNPYGLAKMRVAFADVTRSEDCIQSRNDILDTVNDIRIAASEKTSKLIDTVEQLIKNKDDETQKALFNDVLTRIRVWAESCQKLPESPFPVESKLLNSIKEIHAPRSLHASINRRGDWINFNYWAGIGFGARCQAVERVKEPLQELKSVIKNVCDNSEFASTHGFLNNFSSMVDAKIALYYQNIGSIGEEAFRENLSKDDDYWRKGQSRWGKGRGYKMDILQYTRSWFEDNGELHKDFIEAELQKGWNELLEWVKSYSPITEAP